MILVDTSVWIDHFRNGNARLKELLDNEQILCHPIVIGELACGNLKNRQEILTLLRVLPQAQAAEDEEVVHLLETEKLYGRGLGWLDIHLLASALITRCGIWTHDKPLRKVAMALKLSK